MAVIENDEEQPEYICCPHLPDDNFGEAWSLVVNDGMSINLIGEKSLTVVHLFLCDNCSDIVSNHVLDDVVKRAIQSGLGV